MVNGHRFSSALNTLRTQVFVTITWCQEAPDSTNSNPGIVERIRRSSHSSTAGLKLSGGANGCWIKVHGMSLLLWFGQRICTTFTMRRISPRPLDRYNDSGQDRRRRLRNHWHEYLVWGGIFVDDYRILAVFRGDGPERSVPLCSLPTASRPSSRAILRAMLLYRMCQKSSLSKYIAVLGLKMYTSITFS
jgi:hypothetical protein